MNARTDARQNPVHRPDPMRSPPPLPPPRPGCPRPRTALLVNPFYPKDPHASFGKHVLTPSLALTTLAGVTPRPWSVSYWDENLLQGPPPEEPLPEVVGITVHLTFAGRAYELARWFRARGAVVVLGGPHAQACADEMAPHADAVAIGDGALTWPRILRDVEAGTLQPRYVAAWGEYGDEPLPDRTILPEWAFLTGASLIATRGCSNRCDFCFLSTGEVRPKYQARPVADVVRDFVATGASYGVFLDNNLGASKRYLRDLCGALGPLERIWSAAVTLDVTDDPDLVARMADAGCTGVFIGFESLSDDALKAAGKRSPAAEDWARRVDLLHRHGIQVNGSFVFGFDHDGPDCFERTVEWIEAHRLESATFHILTPYPGTPLFERLKREGRLLHEDWSRYDTAHAVFRPARMSPEALEAGRAWAYRRLFSAASIWRRRPAQTSAVPAYLAMAALYKRANPLWQVLITRRLVHATWAPLVEATRRRHLATRRRSARATQPFTQILRAGV